VYNSILQGEIMSVRIESRSSEIDTEKCVSHAGGRYDLVVAGAQRLRELKRQGREQNRYVTAIDALKEIQAGHVNIIDYMAKVK
jgi:DNA-directed RNA polymerase subunit K/omega